MVTFFSLKYKYLSRPGTCSQKFLRLSVVTVEQGKERLYYNLSSVCRLLNGSLG